ncbi:hypothetical protein [Kitasatospora sp. NPDC127116]|uniref:hypothetical protein n=1 Tax=Kitasatospora sp. NPDC127116 TaxID=3345367 RepID=UPI00362CCC4F
MPSSTLTEGAVSDRNGTLNAIDLKEPAMDDNPPPTVVSYTRRPAGRELNAQQQAAAVWDAADKLGFEIVEIDGVPLDVEDLPHC